MNIGSVLYIAALTLLLGLSLNLNAKDYYLELDINKGINSNVFLSADEDIVVSDTASEQDIQTQFSVMGSYEFFDGKNSDAKILLDYFRESFASNNLDSTVTSVSVPLTFYTDNYRIRATPAVMAYNLSGENVLKYTQGKLDIAQKIKDVRVGMQYGYSKKSSQTSSYDVYEGDSQNIKTYVSFSDYGSSVRLNLNLFDNNYADEYISNNGYYLQARYKKRFNDTGLSVSTKYKNTQYISDLLLDDIARNDQQISIRYMQDYYFNNITEFYFSSEYIKNNSNVAFEDVNYNYQQWVNTVGMRFVF
jgi:hypothetical protein